MKYLLDTCTLIWLCSLPKKLSSRIQNLINNPDNDLLLSYVFLWEMVFPTPLRRWIAKQERIWHFPRLEIEKEHILTTVELPVHHKDPFDRFLPPRHCARIWQF